MADTKKIDDFATVIGPDAKFKGELAFQGGVRIDGEFEGGIATKGQVLVSSTGRVKAEVKAGTVALEGAIEGNVTAEDRVELRATAQMRGDVKAIKLHVVEGATFVGRVEVGANVKPGAAAKPGEPAMRPVGAGAGGNK